MIPVIPQLDSYLCSTETSSLSQMVKGGVIPTLCTMNIGCNEVSGVLKKI